MKYLYILIVLLLIGCSEQNREAPPLTNSTRHSIISYGVREYNYKGHFYLQGVSANSSLIHAAHCPCLNNK